MTRETKITKYAFVGVNLLAHKTAPCGLFALMFTQGKHIHFSLKKIGHFSLKMIDQTRGIQA
jgi:hypothetical protein